MDLWDLFENEEDHIRAEIGQGRLEPRTWECAPLLAINDTDDSLVFAGHANVEVTPHEDGKGTLIADCEVDGRRPSLTGARVRTYNYVGLGATRDGLVARGFDQEGLQNTWYINGAADYYGAKRIDLPAPAKLPPEVPEPE